MVQQVGSLFLVLTSLNANFNIFYRCHAVVLFMFHKYKPEDTSKLMRACGNQNKMDKTKTDDTRKHIP
jgi:hypothetical protein